MFYLLDNDLKQTIRRGFELLLDALLITSEKPKTPFDIIQVLSLRYISLIILNKLNENFDLNVLSDPISILLLISFVYLIYLNVTRRNSKDDKDN
tara:strand:+ start:300 stop:584 length:285 start_codon:yes stop_codon:yes gene_type:complete